MRCSATGSGGGAERSAAVSEWAAGVGAVGAAGGGGEWGVGVVCGLKWQILKARAPITNHPYCFRFWQTTIPSQGEVNERNFLFARAAISDCRLNLVSCS